ncbi:MAG: glucose-1-phosphate cytidylyltransferase [Ferruginibacter sp.]
MKAVILAGGMGTRISEATHLIPKPMVEVGGKPIIWHVMKTYAAHGINEFIICCGYKGYMIKEYFANYFRHNSDITIDLANNSLEIHDNYSEPWKITLIDTGLNTMTGGRVKRIQKYIGDETFLLTYGDGVGDINITETIRQHQASGKIFSTTAYKPEGRFGALEIQPDDTVSSFLEKPQGDGAWINAGYFVCEAQVFDYLSGDDAQILEREPLENISRDGKMRAYKHRGFWKPMDTLRDNMELNALWEKGNAPWKTW